MVIPVFPFFASSFLALDSMQLSAAATLGTQVNDVLSSLPLSADAPGLVPARLLSAPGIFRKADPEFYAS